MLSAVDLMIVAVVAIVSKLLGLFENYYFK